MKPTYPRIGDIIKPGDQVRRIGPHISNGKFEYGYHWATSHAIGERLKGHTPPKTYRRPGGKVRKYARTR